MSIQELMETETEREYLIPDVLPHPPLSCIYGAGGDGKSMSAWALAKHIATGKPFVVRGNHVPVQQGPVVLLNGDQPLVQLKEQLQEVDFPITKDSMIQTDWQPALCPVHQAHENPQAQARGDRLPDWLLWWSSL